ncbi:hypothetical protein [uncultured Albimonas sp.]|uniref:hypothetical protein n=1 Tax=uncultured Albimonas sp. TaxID=1331701 RepID=UPI0030EE7B59
MTRPTTPFKPPTVEDRVKSVEIAMTPELHRFGDPRLNRARAKAAMEEAAAVILALDDLRERAVVIHDRAAEIVQAEESVA